MAYINLTNRLIDTAVLASVWRARIALSLETALAAYRSAGFMFTGREALDNLGTNLAKYGARAFAVVIPALALIQ